MYCGYITVLKTLREHSNADRLLCTEVFGNNVIVSKEDYYVGQRVVFFPTDGQLSEEYATDNNLVRKKDENGNNVGGYLDPDKRNITALRLRGEKSEGLILPIESLSKYTNVDKLKDGEQITVLNGHEICCKYIPRKKKYQSSRSNGGKKEIKDNVSYPYFAEHSDTAQLAYNKAAFKAGDICYITLKCHGTSQRTANTVQVTRKPVSKLLKKLFHKQDKIERNYTTISGTRRTTLTSYEGGYHGSNAFRQPYHDFFKERLPKGMEVFYEVVGWANESTTIMGRCSNKLIKDKAFQKQYGLETVFSYGCEQGKSDCYVYRMTMTNEDGYTVELPTEQVQRECEKMGVKFVPVFEKFIFTTWEDLMERVEKYYAGADPIGHTHVREGVVVRIDNKEKFTAYKHKNFEFRCLEGIIKDNSEEPDMEEAEELLNEVSEL